jgi:hypothetical protein
MNDTMTITLFSWTIRHDKVDAEFHEINYIVLLFLFLINRPNILFP